MTGTLDDLARLSPHLLDAEFLHTSHRGLWGEQVASWHAAPVLRESAQRFAVSVFERVRELTGPLWVTSGYRCGALNAAVGGRPTSKHVLALASDCIPSEMTVDAAMSKIVLALDAGALPDLDEAIIELGWLHIQGAPIGSRARRLALQTHDGVHFEPYVRRAA